jgi:hypothetical protein
MAKSDPASLAGGDGGQPVWPAGRGVDDVGGQAAAGQPGTDADQKPTRQQGAMSCTFSNSKQPSRSRPRLAIAVSRRPR